MIPINTSITLTDAEIELTFSRSQGPGGQNVNKVNSKVTIHWDLK
ncbi:MAG: aminoacyl-tRNA hydrolase, partial [Pirellulaceae bacterium]|nr:aminoacyl-tRNA hydrolase [Pirellulaceae bacterium]